jgi:hypothetical protein
MFAVMTRAAERWRAVRVTDFERRQMAVLRQELDDEYEASIGLTKPPSKDEHQNQLSSSSHKSKAHRHIYRFIYWETQTSAWLINARSFSVNRVLETNSSIETHFL